MPAYQNTIKRLRSESSSGQNAIDFGGHIHTQRNGSQCKDNYWTLLYYLSIRWDHSGGDGREKTMPATETTEPPICAEKMKWTNPL